MWRSKNTGRSVISKTPLSPDRGGSKLISSFEGTIPKDEYGGGTVMLWDKGSWEPIGDPHARRKQGRLFFKLRGQRLKGQWDLVRMRDDGKRENWLLTKNNDD